MLKVVPGCFITSLTNALAWQCFLVFFRLYTEYTVWSVPQHAFSRTPWHRIKLCPRHSLSSRTRILILCLWCRCSTSSSLRSRRSSLHPVLPHPGLQRHFRAAQEVGVSPLTPLAGGSLATWSIPLQTQVMSPTCPITRIRSTSPTATQISGSDDVTMISSSARGMPKSEALSNSGKAAANKVSFVVRSY